MSALRAASLRHLLRHPAQLALAFLGLTLGVGTIVAVDVATASAQRAFELSLEAVNGAATQRIGGGPGGIDEQLYLRLRRLPSAAGAPRALLAPVVSGYVTVGSRVLRLLGVDPFAAAELNGGTGARGAGFGVRGASEARDWFTVAGSVVASAEVARELGIAAGATFDLAVGGVQHRARLIDELTDAGPGFDALILTDISQAQEWLGAPGRLSAIDVRVPAGEQGSAALARLRAALPAGLALESTRREARETFAMTDAFTTNLKAMSLLALLVGTLLIYGAVSFAVLQRRATIGVLRALGATRGEVLRLMLGEAAVLGVAGGACGCALGLLIAHALVGLVSQTINDLYFVVAVRSVSVPAGSVALAFTAALATALVAALLPALEAAGSAPRLALTRSLLERRAVHLARRLVVVSLALACGAAATLLLSSRSLLAGFAALFMLLAAAAALTPAALYALARSAARLLARSSPAARLACADVASSLSRTGVAVAALGMALAAMLGVAIMVASFRDSLREWLSQTLRADIYVSAPGVADSRERRLDSQVVAALLAVPGVRAHSEGRRATVDSPRGPVDLNAVSLAPESHPGFIFVRGDPARAWPEFARGAILITEPLAWRLGLAPGDALELRTPRGPQAFGIAGVYREYGNDRGEVLMDLAEYRGLFGDDGIAALGLYLAPGASTPRVIGELRAAALGRQSLLIRSNADIRTISMGIFERTFVITRVLNWLAAGVAALGLLSALLAWELSRSRELGLIRILGLTPGSTALLVIGQTLFMGLAALLAAVPAGLLTALTLTEVINRRAFGWHIGLHLAPAQFTSALWLALAAALAAGLYPGWRAARMPLAGAVRDE
ncbi:MAG TPA: FtsX-like permease family protein [Steroidobacteraceae bacterium]|nr:FtsX-like permease family protein [Steroidobacteraceae bacterium]